VRCAPPANKPTTEEFDRCEELWLRPEVALLRNVSVVLALGALAWRVAWRVWGSGPRPAFGHGALAELATGPPHWLIGSYHVSQQNTFTGRLTEPMLDAVLARCRELSR
jgi:uracil-DNA glycosylase